METLLAGLEGWPLAGALRSGRWSYAAVNAAHIVGIALLLGSIVPLNLRMFGLWSAVPVETLARVLVPVAATGLALAITAGVMLFATRAGEYAANPFLQAKLALVAIGTLSALALHASSGPWLQGAGRRRLAAHAAVSTLCWTGAILCGRLIAFAG